MSKRITILLSALICVSALLYFFLYRSPEQHARQGDQGDWRVEEHVRQITNRQPSVPRSILGARNADKRSNSLAVEFTPEEALDRARHMAACTLSGIDAESYPQDLTDEQEQQLDASRQIANCPADQKYSAYDLVEFAASSGNLQAQVDFPGLAAVIFNKEDAALDESVVQKYKQDSLKYLTSAARAGSPEALSRLSESYQNGRFSKQDLVSAYAYAYAYDQLKGSQLSRLRLDQLGSELSPSNLLRGQELGQSIVDKLN